MAAASGSGGADAVDKHNVKARIIHEVKRFLLIAAYFWVLLTLFVLQERIILSRENIAQNFTPFGFAIVNALILGKVVLIAQDLHFARHLDDRPLIFPTLYKSGAFGVLCVCFYVAEETLVGLWHGKGFIESLPPIAQNGEGAVFGTITLSVEFIPLFALQELSRVIGGDQLRALFFKRRNVRD
jgi:hypothetical protein